MARARILRVIAQAVFGEAAIRLIRRVALHQDQPEHAAPGVIRDGAPEEVVARLIEPEPRAASLPLGDVQHLSSAVAWQECRVKHPIRIGERHFELTTPRHDDHRGLPQILVPRHVHGDAHHAVAADLGVRGPTVREQATNHRFVHLVGGGKLIHQVHHARIELLEHTRP
jgi:hypothetical protein